MKTEIPLWNEYSLNALHSFLVTKLNQLKQTYLLILIRYKCIYRHFIKNVYRLIRQYSPSVMLKSEMMKCYLGCDVKSPVLLTFTGNANCPFQAYVVIHATKYGKGQAKSKKEAKMEAGMFLQTMLTDYSVLL